MSSPHQPLPSDVVLRPFLGRRTLVLGALLSVCAGPVAAARSAVAATPRRSAPYAAASWRGLVGHVLTTPRGAVRLVSITEHEGGPFEAFQLRFVTVDRRMMPEQLVVRHPECGRVPFMVTASGAVGVAVVTRRRS